MNLKISSANVSHFVPYFNVFVIQSNYHLYSKNISFMTSLLIAHLKNKFQWILNKKNTTVTQENELESFVCKYRPFCPLLQCVFNLIKLSFVL